MLLKATPYGFEPLRKQETHPTGTILLVEDEPDVAAVLRLVLLREGNEVVRVASAAEARAIIEVTLPDLIILDMVLPDESGIAVCRQLRGGERTAAIPIVMITGYSDKGRHAAAYDAGAAVVLNKPFQLDDFRAVVCAQLTAATQEDSHAHD